MELLRWSSFWASSHAPLLIPSRAPPLLPSAPEPPSSLLLLCPLLPAPLSPPRVSASCPGARAVRRWGGKRGQGSGGRVESSRGRQGGRGRGEKRGGAGGRRERLCALGPPPPRPRCLEFHPFHARCVCRGCHNPRDSQLHMVGPLVRLIVFLFWPSLFRARAVSSLSVLSHFLLAPFLFLSGLRAQRGGVAQGADGGRGRGSRGCMGSSGGGRHGGDGC